jgi:hypothetical protein
MFFKHALSTVKNEKEGISVFIYGLLRNSSTVGEMSRIPYLR